MSPTIPILPADEKLRLLDRLDDALCGRGPADPEAEPLRIQLRERGLNPRHALELLDAFRQDVRKTRYADWDELMDYCRLSAAPVGRFVLDVHDESPRPLAGVGRAVLGAADHQPPAGLRQGFRRSSTASICRRTLCAATARPCDAVSAEAPAPLALRARWREFARQTSELVARAAPLIPEIKDVRLAAEIAAIHALARRLAHDLESRDPLSERVHLGKAGLAVVGGLGALKFLAIAAVRSVRPQTKVPA